MPANIEIKAVLMDREAAIATAARLADTGPEIILQEDVFFGVKARASSYAFFVLAPARPRMVN